MTIGRIKSMFRWTNLASMADDNSQSLSKSSSSVLAVLSDSHHRQRWIDGISHQPQCINQHKPLSMVSVFVSFARKSKFFFNFHFK